MAEPFRVNCLNGGIVDWRRRGPLTPMAPLMSAWSHRKLITRLAYRDIQARYRGSIMGLAWSIIVPIFLLAVYTFVFSVVFQSRWGVPDTSKAHFAIVLFCGLLVFNFFSDCITRAPTLIVSNTSYVKKVVFPLEVLPWVSTLSALFNAGVGFVVLLVFYTYVEGTPPPSILATPIVLAPFIMLVLGLSLFLSSLGVFLRDLQQFIGIVVTVVMFMSPLFYPIEALPVGYREIVSWSPLTIAISQARSVLLNGQLPHLQEWIVSLVIGWTALWLGFVWFNKTRKGFADVL
jgi:lipopolysaccharide transport system permease protein